MRGRGPRGGRAEVGAGACMPSSSGRPPSLFRRASTALTAARTLLPWPTRRSRWSQPGTFAHRSSGLPGAGDPAFGGHPELRRKHLCPRPRADAPMPARGRTRSHVRERNLPHVRLPPPGHREEALSASPPPCPSGRRTCRYHLALEPNTYFHRSRRAPRRRRGRRRRCRGMRHALGAGDTKLRDLAFATPGGAAATTSTTALRRLPRRWRRRDSNLVADRVTARRAPEAEPPRTMRSRETQSRRRTTSDRTTRFES